MAKSFDPELLTKLLLNAAQETFGRTTKAASTDPTTTKSQNIIEYQGRMSVAAMEKFNGPTYVSSVSLYLNPQDKDKHKAVGAITVYIEASNAEKLLKAFGYSITDDEEDEEVLNASGKFCLSMAENFKKELVKSNYPELMLSPASSEKNSLADGVEFSPTQVEKQEATFYFWRKKALVIDVTLAPLGASR